MLLTDAECEQRRACPLNRVWSDPKSLRYSSIWNKLFGVRQTDAVARTVHDNVQRHLPSPSPDAEGALNYDMDWQALMRVLHMVYTAYWPHECSCKTNAGYSFPIPKERVPNIERRTTAAVVYRQQTWDLIPPEVTRPLAITTIGDIVVLVMRMGMTWRDLRPGHSVMQADGNGHSVMPLQIRGVGTALQFGRDTFGENSSNRSLIEYIPSMDADKMLCGILPVDREIVGKYDFPLFVGRCEFPAIIPVLKFLDVDQSAQDALNQPDLQKFIPGFSEVWRRTAFNDLIFLLAPYMPLNGCSASYVGFRGFLSLSLTNCMTYWEARLALLFRLEKRTQHLPKDSKLFKIRETMQKFEKDERMRKEFYSPAHADDYPDPRPKPEALSEYCAKVFRETQEYFKDLNKRYPTAKPNMYCNLVAAHCSIAVPAAIAARDRVLDQGRLDLSIHRERSPRFSMWQTYEIAWSYVDFVEQGNLHSDLVRQGDRQSLLSHEQAEEAWWMMILRGMTWGLSVYICTTDHTPDARVSIVPSRYWKTPTPIWLA